MRTVGILASVGAACALIPTGTAAAQPHFDGEVCGQIVAHGSLMQVTAFPTPCDEAMAVAQKMVATWPEGSRFVKFDGWSCAGVTGGEVDEGATWDLDCENEGSGGMVIFDTVGA
jgi:hypothetical protein